MRQGTGRRGTERPISSHTSNPVVAKIPPAIYRSNVVPTLPVPFGVGAGATKMRDPVKYRARISLGNVDIEI